MVQATSLSEPVAAAPVSRGYAALQGDIRKVSVVMADLRGFTTFCERVPPGLMSRVLNEYLTAMIEVILGQQGRVQDSSETESSGFSAPRGRIPIMPGTRRLPLSRCRWPSGSWGIDGNGRQGPRSPWAWPYIRARSSPELSPHPGRANTRSWEIPSTRWRDSRSSIAIWARRS